MNPQKQLEQINAAIEVQQKLVDGIMAAHEHAGNGYRGNDTKWLNKKYSKERRLLESFQRAKRNIEIAAQVKKS